MATINATGLTLADLAARMDPDRKNISPFVNLLDQYNAFVPEMAWVEGNLPTGHQFVSVTALPSVTYRRYNEGVAASKGQTAPTIEACSQIASRFTLDEDLAEINGMSLSFRASEEKLHVQAMSNEAEYGMIYNSTSATPEKWHGLAPRFNATTQAMGGSQIVLADAAPSGSDQTSVWLVGWSDDTVFGIYPKGSKAGLEIKDGGRQLVSDGTNDFWAFVTDMKWKLGLCVKDHRYVSRVANIDTSAISATGDNIMPAMIRAHHKIFKPEGVRLAYYTNRTVGTYLHLQALEKTVNSTLSIENIGGRPVTTFLGHPVRPSDEISDTESVLS